MDNILDVVKEWQEYAEMDLASARYLLNMRPAPLEIIAYHCQQCAEKYIKSYLVYKDREVQKIHDLVKLCKQCAEFEKEFLTIEHKCAVLFPYATDTRYPGQKIDLTDTEIELAFKYVDDIKEFVLNMIGTK